MPPKSICAQERRGMALPMIEWQGRMSFLMRPLMPRSQWPLRYRPRTICAMRRIWRMYAKPAWALPGTNSRPPWAWPRKKPTMARAVPKSCVGTCHRDFPIYGTLDECGVQGGEGWTYTEDHAYGEDDTVRQHLDEDVNPEHRILDRLSVGHPTSGSKMPPTIGSREMVWPSGILSP
jgi:hypothetical protein